MALSFKTHSYEEQIRAATKTAQKAILKPREVTDTFNETQTGAVPAHNLQNRIAAAFQSQPEILGRYERLVQLAGVIIVAVSTWVIGYSIYSHL